MRPQLVELGELMPGRGVSVDPAKHQDEEFALFSVPAYDSQVPDRVKGRQIGSSKQVVHPGDVLLSKIVPHIRRAWIVPESDQRRQIGSSEWIIFRSPRFHGPYLRHLLISDQFNSKLMQTVSGVGGSLLRARPTGVAMIKVPLPSIEEQRRIAAILDQVEELRAKRRAAIALLDQLPQAIFLEMFGDPATNPKGWPLHQLSTVVREGTTVTYGIVQAGDEFPGGVPYIRTGDIVEGEIALDGLRHTDPMLAAKFQRSRVETGEIVMSIRATVGTTAMVPDGLNGANLTQGTARIAPGTTVDKLYLLSFLRSPGTQRWLNSQIKGATFREITLSRLRELPVLLPPLDLQRRFATSVESISRVRAAQRAALNELDALFASLQHRAFARDI